MNINAFPSIAKFLGLKFYKHLTGVVHRKSIKQIKGCVCKFSVQYVVWKFIAFIA